jgi:SprT protein
MHFTHKLEKIFVISIVAALGYLAYSMYQSYRFKHSPLSVAIQERVHKKEAEVLRLIEQKFKRKVDIPLVISDEFHSNLYGLTSYKDAHIAVYLNKKRFKESVDYMIDEVIPHEYAHAMVFIMGAKTSQDGHTKLWQKVCLELGGRQCERYVDGEEIVRQKMGL